VCTYCLSVCAKMMRNQTRVGHTIVDLETVIIGTHPNCFDPTSRENEKKNGPDDDRQIVYLYEKLAFFV